MCGCKQWSSVSAVFFIKHESKTLTRTELARRRLAEAVSAQYIDHKVVQYDTVAITTSPVPGL